VALLAAVVLFPFLWLLQMSVKPTADITAFPFRWLFTPTAGRQHTIVGEARRTGRSPDTSMTTATLPMSPASQCSLCARIVASGPVTVKLEQRST